MNRSDPVLVKFRASEHSIGIRTVTRCGGTTVRFYGGRDPYSFFFQEYRDGREGVRGGLVLHRQADMTKDKYYVHT